MRFAPGSGGCSLLLDTPDPVLRDRLDQMGIARVAFVHSRRAVALAAAKAISPRRLRAHILATPGAAATARGIVRDACDDWRLPGLVEDAELVVTELIDNVVLHAGGTADLLLTLRGQCLHVAVRDGDPTRPERTLPDPDTHDPR